MIFAFSVLDLVFSAGLFIVPFFLLISGVVATGASLFFAGGIILIAVLSVIFYIALCILTAKDIKEKGISWANMVLPILLGGIGGIAYYFIHRGRGPKSQKPSA